MKQTLQIFLLPRERVCEEPTMSFVSCFEHGCATPAAIRLEAMLQALPDGFAAKLHEGVS